MPNYVCHRAIITGPEGDVQRLHANCIRAPRDEDKNSFDFEAVVPMPEPIARTRDDNSQTAQEQALRLTGYKDWYDWSLANWGVKWNCSGFTELFREPGRFDCVFETAWSYPTPIMDAIAAQYPSLTVQIFSIEEGMDWGYVGDIRGGIHTGADVPITRKLKYLVYEAEGGARIPAAGLGPESVGHGFHCEEDAARRINDAWSAAHAKFNDQELELLKFADDAEGFLEWLEISDAGEDGAPSPEEAQDALGMYVESEANLGFFLEQNRFASELDRDLMRVVATAIKQRALSGQSGPEVQLNISGILDRYSEDDLRAWAAHAMFRPLQGIQSSDLETLRASAIFAGDKLLADALRHLQVPASPSCEHPLSKAA